MTPGAAKETVVLSLVATAAIVTIAGAARGQLPRPRQLLGVGFAYVGLAALATPAPQLAASGAVLVAVTTALVRGPEAFKAVGDAPGKVGPLGSGSRPYALTGASMADSASSSPNAASTPAGGSGGPVAGPPLVGKIIAGVKRFGQGPGDGTHSFKDAPNNWESDNAVDVPVAVGTPVYAPYDGVIGSSFGLLPGAKAGGRFAGLRLHLVGPGQELYYAHLSRFAPGISPGVRVKAGTVLGYTGSANGVAHLHLGAKVGDPRRYF